MRLAPETRVMRECIPANKQANCIRNSRIYVCLVGIVLLAIIFGSFTYFSAFNPKILCNCKYCLGYYSTRWLKEDVKDHRLSTRSLG